MVAARMAVADFGPTVLGLPIEVIDADTLNKIDHALGVANAWYNDGVDAIVDLPYSPVAVAVQKLARERSRTIMIATSSVTELTSKLCGPTCSHWADDIHSLVRGSTQALNVVKEASWFLISPSTPLGASVVANATPAIQAQGGTIVGTTGFPIGLVDFSPQIAEARASGAKVIGITSSGEDQIYLLRRIAQIGLQGRTGVIIVSFLVAITEIDTLGLLATQGLIFPAGFYWDHSDGTRAFSKRFFAERKRMPTGSHAQVYAATTHFLRAIAKAGTRDPFAVNLAMRALAISRFGETMALRSDGRAMQDMVTYRVKSPEESTGPCDYLAPVETVDAVDAFLAVNPACNITAPLPRP